MDTGELNSLQVTSLNSYDLTQVKPELRFCSKGHDQDAFIVGIFEDWGILYECRSSACSERWVVCCKCTTNVRARLRKRRALTQHKSKYHAKKQLAKLSNGENSVFESGFKEKRAREPNDNTLIQSPLKRTLYENSLLYDFHGDENAIVLNNMDDEFLDESREPKVDHSAVFFPKEKISFLPLADDTSLGFTSKRSTIFFKYCASRNPDTTTLEEAGIEYLVKTCLIGQQLNLQELKDMQEIPRSFQQLIMKYARLCFNNGKKDRSLLSNVVSLMHHSGMEDGWSRCQEVINNKFNNLHPMWKQGRDYINQVVALPYSASLMNKGAHRFSFSFPTNEKEIRAKFVDNKTSIKKNLPMPEIKSDIPDHAYVSLEECIRHAVALSGCRVQTIEPFPEDYKERMWHLFATSMTDYGHHEIDKSAVIYHPSMSRCAYEISKNNRNHDGHSVTGYLLFWHDDADTNSSSMQGRAQVWVKSMTIGTPLGHGNFALNTYPVAIGLKSESHDAVEQRHNEDLKRLADPSLHPFFVGDVNKTVRCNFYVMADVADQPEKRGSNGLLLGSAKWAARSFVSANHTYLYPRLKACNKCLYEMKHRFSQSNLTEPLPLCNECLNWDVLKSNTDHSLIPIPNNYPYAGLMRPNQPPLQALGLVNRIITKTDPSNSTERRFIKPFRITYSGMASALQEAHYGYRDFGWTEKMCQAFLEVECFNKSTIKDFFDYAERARAYKEITSDSAGLDFPIDPNYKHTVITQYEKSPEMFGPMPLPANHKRPGVETHKLLEGLLHVGAVGCTKKSVLTVQDAFEARKCNSTFIKANAEMLAPLKKLNLEWMKLLSYSGGKFHGWNGENYMAFARVMPWFYQNISEAKKEKSLQMPDEKSQKLWTKPYNLHWLKIRGLPIKGNAKQLRDKVAEYLSSPNPPSILPELYVSDEQIQILVNALYDMWGCLLGKVVSAETILKSEYAIRIFLSAFDDMDSSMRQDTPANKPKPPGVVSSYNFCCLLNLPDMMRTHGPLHHFYEGGKQGEGILPEIKELHSQGIRKNWAKSLLKNVYVDRAYEVLLNGHDARRDGESALVTLPVGKGLFKYYSAMLEVHTILLEDNRRRKQPLSVVLVADGYKMVDAKIFAVIGSNNEVVDIRMAGGLSEQGAREKFGWFYYEFILEKAEATTSWKEAIACFGLPCIEYGLLLPLLDPDPTSGMFALISRNWMRLGPHNTLEALIMDY